MTLRTRIALLVGVTVLVASAIGGIGTAISSGNVGRDRVDQALLTDAETFQRQNPRLTAQLQFAFEARRATCDDDVDDETEPADPAARGPATRLRYLPEFASHLQLIRPKGTAIAACQTLPISAGDALIAASGIGRGYRTVAIDGERFRVLTRGFVDVGAIQCARSLEITEDTLRALLVRSFVFGLVGAALASALGWLLAKRATEPVKRLSDAAERVARTQDLGERIDVEGDNEIAALATSFNTMLSSLDTSREQQKRLVQDASHELRTPLTSMRTNVELLQRHDDIDPHIRVQMLADIGAELNELTQLTTELVDSATEVPTTLQLRDEVDLAAVVRDCVERARRRHRRTIEIVASVQPDTIVLGDVALLSRAITNLINNAVKFSDESTEIAVEVTPGSVLVQDRGRGIPPSDLPFVFDRFYRATTARSAPGSGLGLSIVKQIVAGHGGTVQALNRAGGGAEIGFVLPTMGSAPLD